MIREFLEWWWAIILLGLAAFFGGGCSEGQRMACFTWGPEGSGMVYSGPATTPGEMLEEVSDAGEVDETAGDE